MDGGVPQTLGRVCQVNYKRMDLKSIQTHYYVIYLPAIFVLRSLDAASACLQMLKNKILPVLKACWVKLRSGGKSRHLGGDKEGGIGDEQGRTPRAPDGGEDQDDAKKEGGDDDCTISLGSNVAALEIR